ncbi:S8 family serine peptidase [Candidatus Woesearchaeota archaeon]|nr:S8 family serine peptidase [Candidatus Woesearchaeota archaeon]
MKKYNKIACILAIIVITVLVISVVDIAEAKHKSSNRKNKLNLQSSENQILVEGVDIEGKPLIDGERWIIPKTVSISNVNLKSLGCQVIHDLSDIIAVKCPKDVKIENAVLDEIYYILDIDADRQINAHFAWELGYNGSGQTIAVLDTGIDTDHPELVDSIVGGQGFGFPTYEDDNGHGTHVAGIITANGIDKKAKGVAPGANIWSAKVCNIFGICHLSDIEAAIEYIVDNNIAKIMSMSFGSGGTDKENCDSDLLSQKVNWAVSNGVTVVVASGSEAGNVSSPGCASGAIAVGNVDSNDVRVSNSGSGLALDIMAPGFHIYSTITGGLYAYIGGTSMSTPHVSATIALLRQANPSLTDAEIKDVLYRTAKDLGTAGWDEFYGWGRVDVLAALRNVTNVSNDLLLAVTPGISNTINNFDAINAVPNSKVHYVYGNKSGSRAVPNCIGVNVSIGNPKLGGNDISDGNGYATLSKLVPRSARGKKVLFQAVNLVSCKVSNLVEEIFT